MLDSKISIAPLMGYTDPFFCRLMHWIAPDIHLFTEMLHANSIIFADKHKRYGDLAPMLSLQLGGSNPDELSQAASLAADFGYADVNLNLGCPSPRVQKGAFGACLMKEKHLVQDCLIAMQAQQRIPVSIKCRIGVDECDDEAFFYDFMAALHQVGCTHWVIHARKALLEGLSPKENREIPPLCYERVWRLKSMYPHAHITINGGIDSPEAIAEHLKHVDAVMIGRWAIANPWSMRQLQLAYFPSRTHLLSRDEIIGAYLCHIRKSTNTENYAVSYLLRHLSAMFSGEKNAKIWRNKIAQCHSSDALVTLIA